ncbi:DUF1963 domain-containing protein [Deinococcus sp. QL22]|uniref:DUF1963 domain-containing protein n=1 Tax=Deinococcus sp. QL22 TaxID=2939437 RepID=UPI00201718A1|nr:DUF1963 domain-containing protein [Deinococcus sp. QL22]UQN06472.1 YwqG family protein [Deinococcus sp. QL22]
MTLISRDPRTLAEVHHEIRTVFQQAGLPRDTNAERLIRQGLDTAYEVTLERADEHSFALGESKFGGHPHVLPEWPWPTDPQGMPLRFLYQIQLACLEPERTSECLPTEGLLSVFWDFFSRSMELTYHRTWSPTRGPSLQRRDDAQSQLASWIIATTRPGALRLGVAP